MPVTPGADRQGTAAAEDDQQVATWTRMLQAGTLTEAGYLAMVTAWAQAAFEQRRQQEGGAVAGGGPVVVHATQLPMAAAVAAPQLGQDLLAVPEDNQNLHEELSSDGSSGDEQGDDEWLPGSGGDSSSPAAPQGRRRSKQQRTPQATCVSHCHSCFGRRLTMSVRWCAAAGVRSGAGRR